jgi:hypothetical protein
MALPMNSTPIYNLVVPSTKKSVNFRPFLVKDQKALLIAQQSADQVIMVDTLKEIIKSCISESIDVERLAIFDIEYIFTQLRAKSVGETVDIILSCDEDHGEDNKKAKLEHTVDLSKIQVVEKEGHTNKIGLFGDVGVVMKYPSINTIKQMNGLSEANPDDSFKLVANSIDYIYDNDEVYHSKDQTSEELMEFINNLTAEQFGKIQKFFDTMPKLTHTIDYNCPVCNKAHIVVLEGMESFF